MGRSPKGTNKVNKGSRVNAALTAERRNRTAEQRALEAYEDLGEAESDATEPLSAEAQLAEEQLALEVEHMNTDGEHVLEGGLRGPSQACDLCMTDPAVQALFAGNKAKAAKGGKAFHTATGQPALSPAERRRNGKNGKAPARPKGPDPEVIQQLELRVEQKNGARRASKAAAQPVKATRAPAPARKAAPAAPTRRTSRVARTPAPAPRGRVAPARSAPAQPARRSSAPPKANGNGQAKKSNGYHPVYNPKSFLVLRARARYCGYAVVEIYDTEHPGNRSAGGRALYPKKGGRYLIITQFGGTARAATYREANTIALHPETFDKQAARHKAEYERQRAAKPTPKPKLLKPAAKRTVAKAQPKKAAPKASAKPAPRKRQVAVTPVRAIRPVPKSSQTQRRAKAPAKVQPRVIARRSARRAR